MSKCKQQIASAAASLIYEEGYDYEIAKHKASSSFACTKMPKNSEVYAELLNYVKTTALEKNQQLFLIQKQIALEAMQFLNDYRPLIVGQLLDGIAAPYTAIKLHLFASTHEEVIFFLEQKKISYETHELTLKMGKHYIQYPSLSFFVDKTQLELIIFPDDRQHKIAPISPINNKPMKRITAKKFQTITGLNK